MSNTDTVKKGDNNSTNSQSMKEIPEPECREAECREPECREPECREPEWKANRDKCTGCVKRTTEYGTLGCKYCDENWDVPDLIYYT